MSNFLTEIFNNVFIDKYNFRRISFSDKVQAIARSLGNIFDMFYNVTLPSFSLFFLDDADGTKYLVLHHIY